MRSFHVAQSNSQRFRRTSSLRFLLFAYNTELSPTDSKPDVAVQIQVVRDGQPVITTAPRKISTEGIADLSDFLMPLKSHWIA